MADHRAPDAGKPAYSPPSIAVVSEDELLKTFQVTSAAVAWWVPGVGGST